MLFSAEGCDDPTFQDRGDASSSEGRFGCDVVTSIYFNRRDAAPAYSRQVFNVLLVEVMHGFESGDAFT